MKPRPTPYRARALPLSTRQPAELMAASPTQFGHALTLVMADGAIPAAALATSAVVFHSAEQLVILFEGHYTHLRTSSTTRRMRTSGKTPSLWEQSDVFEFFIGRHARKTHVYKEFQVAPDGQWLDLAVTHQNGSFRGDDAWSSGCQCRSAVDAKNHIWRSLIEIPWKAIMGEEDSRSDWHCNFYRASGRFHGDELLAWSPTGVAPGSFHRTEYFGNLDIE